MPCFSLRSQSLSRTRPCRSEAWHIGTKNFKESTLRYGLSLVCVAIALGLALTLQYYQFRDVELPVLTLPIALVTWYAGAGPSVLAIVLATGCFAFFFAEPLYSFEAPAWDCPLVG